MKALSELPSPDTLPHLLSARELAPLARCCERTIGNLAKKPGALPPHVQIGARKFWAKADVFAWLTAQTATAGSATN